MAGFALCSAACGLAPGDGWLIAFRAMQGFAAGLMMPVSMAIIGATFRTDDLTSAYGLWSGTSSIGFVVGPLVGGLLVEQFGWQSVFWVNVPLALLLIPLVLWLVPAAEERLDHPIDAVGAVLSTAALGLIAAALIGTTRTPWTAPATLAPLAVGIILAGAFLAWEARTDNPLLPLEFFRARGFALGGAVGAVVYAFPAVLLLLTLYFQGILGDSPSQAALLFMPVAGAMTVVAAAAGPITRRTGALPSMTIGMLLMAAGSFGLSGLTDSESLPRLVLGEAAFGTGIMLAIPAASAAMMESVPRERSGAGSAAMQASRQVGAVLFVAVLSALAAARTVSLLGSPFKGDAALRADAIGARIASIRPAAGDTAATAAASAWTAGMRAAMLAVALSALAAAGACAAVAVRRRASSRLT